MGVSALTIPSIPGPTTFNMTPYLPVGERRRGLNSGRRDQIPRLKRKSHSITISRENLLKRNILTSRITRDLMLWDMYAVFCLHPTQGCGQTLN